ncbi:MULTISPECIES: phage tail protein [unclassified Pseudovibrio]|uniref:phage tail protein n=1 Tax=unclassified Pseudovibrio TaxID=2627060 RepID=UPI00070D0F2F|nr:MULTISPECIES: phage tail protein [unclassified Pseudovibrio]KZL19711.1 Phage P2 GpU [Pseudovibrio sp. Ad37]
MSRPLAALGMFVFAPDVGSFEELERRWKFIWAKPDPIGGAPVKQWTGPGDQTLIIKGGIWPEIQPAGSWKMEAIAARAGSGQPMTLILSSGRVLGRWCVEEIFKKETEFVKAGSGTAMEFSINLSRYSGASSLWPF